MPFTGEPYVCEICHGRFTRTRSDQEAEAERLATWRRVPDDDDTGIVCDDCYQQLVAWAMAEHPELLS